MTASYPSPIIQNITILGGTTAPFIPTEDGQILIGSTGNDPVLGTITAGANVTVTNTPGGIEIAATGTIGAQEWNAGTVTTVGANLTLTSGTLAASGGSIPGFSGDGSGPTVAIASNGITLTAASGGLTIPPSGDATFLGGNSTFIGSDGNVLIASGGTVTIGGAALTFNGGAVFPSIDGQILIGHTGTVPALNTITAGSGITVTNGPGSIEISATGGGGVTGGPVLSATMEISQAQLTTLNSSPVQIVPAPGVGKTASVISAEIDFFPGSSVFGSNASIQIGWSPAVIQAQSSINITSATAQKQTIYHNNLTPTPAAAENKSILVLNDDQNFGIYGPVTAISSHVAGQGWVVGDQFTMSLGNGAAVGEVTTQSPLAFNAPVTEAAAGGANTITGVDQGGQTFSVGADLTAALVPSATFTVSGSTGNDGTYTVMTAVFSAGTTTITTVEAIPSATADGNVNTGGALGIAGDHTAEIIAGNLVTVRGSTGNDGVLYAVSVSVFDGTNTILYVVDMVPSNVADGVLYLTGGLSAASVVSGGQSYTTSGPVLNCIPISGSLGSGAQVLITVSTPATGTATVTVLYQVLPYVPVPAVPIAGVGVVPGPVNTQATATQLGYGINMLAPSFTDYGAVQLPPASAGAVTEIGIQGSGAQWISLFAKYGTADQINACGNNAAQFDAYFGMPNSYNPTPSVRCVCVTDGAWVCNVQLD